MRARKLITTLVLGVLGAVPAVAMSGGDAAASSHREAPFITKMPKVDGTDFYMFRSYEAARLTQDYVTLIANYQPFEDAYGGPNYFTMDPEALYEIHIDNNADAKEDITFQFRFTNALAGGDGAKLDIGAAGAKKSVAIPLINATPGTTGDTNLNVQESFTAKIIRGDRRTSTDVKDIQNAAGNATTFRKPVDNIGVKSFGGLVDRCHHLAAIMFGHLPARRDAIAAPSASTPNLAQTISGSTTPKPAKVENPQSVPAMTRSAPTIST